MTSAIRTPGRVPLAVTPGSRPVVAVHDIGSQRADRDQWISLAQREWGAWAYAQRGHAPSAWVAGQLYRMSDFTIDLLRLLRDVVAEPSVLAGQGAGGLVAVLAAAAAPDLVTGLHLVAGARSGWADDPARLVSQDDLVNRCWLASTTSAPRPGRGDGDDPILALGPAEPLYQPAVRAAAAQVGVPWWAADGHFLTRWLPSRVRAAAPLLPPFASSAVVV